MSEPADYDEEIQSFRDAGLRWQHDRELAMETMREEQVSALSSTFDSAEVAE